MKATVTIDIDVTDRDMEDLEDLLYDQLPNWAIVKDIEIYEKDQ